MCPLEGVNSDLGSTLPVLRHLMCSAVLKICMRPGLTVPFFPVWDPLRGGGIYFLAEWVLHESVTRVTSFSIWNVLWYVDDVDSHSLFRRHILENKDRNLQKWLPMWCIVIWFETVYVMQMAKIIAPMYCRYHLHRKLPPSTIWWHGPSRERDCMAWQTQMWRT